MVSVWSDNWMGIPKPHYLTQTAVLKLIVGSIETSAENLAAIIWIEDLLTMLHSLLNFPWSLIHYLFILNDPFQLYQGKLGWWAHTPVSCYVSPNVRCSAEKHALQHIYKCGMQSILFFQSELISIQVPFSSPQSFSPCNLPPFSKPTKVYV